MPDYSIYNNHHTDQRMRGDREVRLNNRRSGRDVPSTSRQPQTLLQYSSMLCTTYLFGWGWSNLWRTIQASARLAVGDDFGMKGSGFAAEWSVVSLHPGKIPVVLFRFGTNLYRHAAVRKATLLNEYPEQQESAE